MADEAVLRIILDSGTPSGSTATGDGVGQASGGTTLSSPAPTPNAATPRGSKTPQKATGPEYDPSNPYDVALRRVKREEFLARVDEIYAELKPPPPQPPDPPFDPAEEARKRVERERKRAEVDAEYAKLNPPPPPVPDPPFDPLEEAKKRVRKEEQRAQVQAEYNKLKPPELTPPDPPFDPVEAAKKIIEREERRAATEKEYAKLKPPEPPVLEPAFDPAEAAKKRLEREKQRTEVDAEYAKLNPPEPPPNAHELALKRLEAEKKRQEVEREYQKLNPPVPRPEFDPMEVAKKRRDSERRAAQVQDAYEKEYGEQSKRGSLDLIFAKISTLRGTLGGLLGTTVGAGLDIFHLMRREQFEQEKKDKRKQLLKEADEASATKFADVADKYDADPRSTTMAGSISSALSLAKKGFGVGDKPSKSKSPDLPSASSLAPAPEDGTGIDRGEDPYKATTGIAGAIEKFGGYVPVIGAAVISVGAAVSVMSSLMNSVNRMAENYGQYSPEIAQAQALADIRKTLNDMNRAYKSSDEMSKFIEAQSNMEQRWEDIKLKIMMVVIPILTDILDTVARLLSIAEGDQFDVQDPTEVILNDPNRQRYAPTSETGPGDIIGELRGQ